MVPQMPGMRQGPQMIGGVATESDWRVSVIDLLKYSSESAVVMPPVIRRHSRHSDGIRYDA